MTNLLHTGNGHWNHCFTPRSPSETIIQRVVRSVVRSPMAPEYPHAHEDGAAHRVPLRSPHGPGAGHQVSFPFLWEWTHPVRQLTSGVTAGERGAVSLQGNVMTQSRALVGALVGFSGGILGVIQLYNTRCQNPCVVEKVTSNALEVRVKVTRL